MVRLLDKPVMPTAVLMSNDMTAIGALGAMFERGLKVPDDMSIIGFDDIELNTFSKPGLTTVRVSRKEIAKVAFHALYDSRDNPSAKGVEFTVQPTLIERNTTGAAPNRHASRHPLKRLATR